MSEKMQTVLVGLCIAGFFGYVLYSGFNEKCLSFKGQNFTRDEKPFFYWALMFLAAFLTFAGVVGILSIFSK